MSDPIARLDGFRATRAPRQCFAVARREPTRPCTVALDSVSAQALSELLPLLGCGEEAAIASFDTLAATICSGTTSKAALQAIAEDERRHDALLRGLQVALPQPAPNPALRGAARRFHLSLATGSHSVRLARIAGIDAAVCTILSRVLRPVSAVARDAGAFAVLSCIRRDETRHVAISRSIALAALEQRRARDAAAEARFGLAQLLMSGATAFEQLGVDPARLLKTVSTLPDGLFPR